ncbi:MAG: hypothetical protein WCD18_03515 [Thermosynechococcaceae cyanobacterium]
MKNFLTVVALPLTVATVTTLGNIQWASAQKIQSKFSRPIPQSLLAQSTPDSSITPTSQVGSLPADYGLVRSVSSGVLEVRTLDGGSKQLTIPESLAGSASGLRPGDLVGYETDATGTLTKLEPPKVERTFEGTISSIDGDEITVRSGSGDTMTTTMETAAIARKGFVPGKQVSITTYEGTWATKVCCVETPVTVVPTPPTPTPRFTGGGTPLPPKPVPGLW